MVINICGSVKFMKEMKDLREDLYTLGAVEVFIPDTTNASDKILQRIADDVEDGTRKIEHDLIKGYNNKIKKSDAILVANYAKDGVKGYIGGNTFLEMGFAFVQNKKIFLLNPIPKMKYSAEIIGMQPVVINGDLKKVFENTIQN